MITTINEFKKINENIGDTHQQRFDRAIYLTYVERHLDNEFKKVDRATFEEKLNDKVAKKIPHQYDLNNIYRLADTKETWFDANGSVIGEIYKETHEDSNVESCWISAQYL